MNNLSGKLNELMSMTSEFTGAETLASLKHLYEKIVSEADSLNEDIQQEINTTLDQKESLESNMGFREKKLGGLFGGDRNKAQENKELQKSIETAEGLSNNLQSLQEELDSKAMEHAIGLIIVNDREFSKIVEYQDLMAEAVQFTGEVLREIDEAIEALDEAEAAEELDMMTDSEWLDHESDMANYTASDEVQDVNNILVDYRKFLSDMGESAVGLYGSDFDFSWGDMMNEDFFGDFWGGGEMIAKISRGRFQMEDLHNRIHQLYSSFSEDYDRVVAEINTRVNEEWDNA